MKKIVTFFIILAFVFSVTPAFAAKGGEKGASQTAYERASEESIFHRVGDWFATIGKSEEEKKAIISERKTKRAKDKMEKKSREMKKEMEKNQKSMGKNARGMMGE